MTDHQNISEEFIEANIDRIDWWWISNYTPFSEKLIEKYVDRVHWYFITQCQRLSEAFIEKHTDRVDWYLVSTCQTISEAFIEKHSNRINWRAISECQRLSEAFIEKHTDRLDWCLISRYQPLSEAFIEKHTDKLNRRFIAEYQNLSIEFAKKHNLTIYVDGRSTEDKRAEIAAYAKIWNLKFENDTLYAYREHDRNNHGRYDLSIYYDELKRYEDWHCDMNPENENSFGLGIWPKGNVQISVHLNDWGTVVLDNGKGKCRVKAFTLLSFPT